MKRDTRSKANVEVIGLLGVGLDGDGQARITQFDKDIVVLGGSADTHERMADTMARFTEALERRGKRLREIEPAEVRDLLRDASR